MYLPIIFTIFQKNSKIRGAMPLAGHHSINQIWACAHLFGTLIYSICKISSIFYGNTWSKIFQNTKLLFYILWKVWTTNTLSLNSWVGEAYISIRLENGTLRKRNMAKHYREDLCFEQDAAQSRNTKKLYIIKRAR